MLVALILCAPPFDAMMALATGLFGILTDGLIATLLLIDLAVGTRRLVGIAFDLRAVSWSAM